MLLRTCIATLLTVGLTTAAGAQTGPASPGVREQAGDAWITTKIQAAYFLDADVKGRTIDVTTANAVVTLTGRVENEREHDQAVSIARTIRNISLTAGAGRKTGVAENRCGRADINAAIG